jgi:hypothetical protein
VKNSCLRKILNDKGPKKSKEFLKVDNMAGRLHCQVAFAARGWHSGHTIRFVKAVVDFHGQDPR